jgi:short-subunit dehydrogenase
MSKEEEKANPVVIITGASAGVGRATAIRFAKSGAKLGLISRNLKRLQSLKKEVEALGAEAAIYTADVANEDEVFKAADEFEKKLGTIDIWINNAMVTVDAEFVDMDPKEFRRVTDVCYHGFVYGTMAALSKMYPHNQGVIVLVGSALAYRGIPLQSAYCGAKHAIQGFSESVRSELRHNKKNIFITMVQMPALNTPQFAWCKTNGPRKPKPIPPIYQPEIAAEAIFWSAHHPKKREIIVGWRNSIIVWGNKFFPGLGDKYLAKTCFEAQMTDEMVEENRKFNLWETVPGPFGAHGTFDKLAAKHCPQLFFVKHSCAVKWMMAISIAIVIFLIVRYA